MGLFDGILDRSIFFSFDRSGYRRHQRGFDPSDLDQSMREKVCVVTGANSGLGFEVATGLAARGAAVHMLCRDAGRGAEARQKIAGQHQDAEVFLHVVDIARPGSIRSFAEHFTPRRVDVLVHNAGLLPLTRETTEAGIELTVATHLVGPFLLTRLLRPRLREARAARVIFVSSGGMYAERVGGETGRFWFDRRAVPTHLMRRTQEDESQRRRLWQLCERFFGALESPAFATAGSTPKAP